MLFNRGRSQNRFLVSLEPVPALWLLLLPGGLAEGAPGRRGGCVGGRLTHGLVLHDAGGELGLGLGHRGARRAVGFVHLERKLLNSSLQPCAHF